MNVRSGLLSVLAFAGVALGAPSARALTFEYCNFSSVGTLTLNSNAAQLNGSTLRLTQNAADKIGSAYRTAAVPWTATTSFHTYFTFQLSPNAGGADGISFILQNSAAGAAAIGKNGGALGYGGDNGQGATTGGIGSSVEVEFDTYQNTWDPNANHVGIMENGANQTHLATGTPAFTMANGGDLYAWIDYAAATTTLSVYIAQTATKPAAAIVTYSPIDISTLVGAQAFVGFTGGTGGSTNLQEIFEWEFSTDGLPCVCGGSADCSGATPSCAPMGNAEAGLCVACLNDAACDSNANTGTPICSTSGATVDSCVACSANTDCAAAGLAPVCKTSGPFLGQCVVCATNPDCAGNPSGPVCLAGAATTTCVQCTSNANCSGATPVCNTTTHTCQPCASDASCSAPTPACQASGALAGECTQCSATNMTACTGASPVCDTATGACVGCVTNANCAGGSPICNQATATCRACATNTDCASFAGAPVCDTAGMRQGQCVGCQADTDCSGAKSACDQATNTCVGCVTNAECSGTTPVCSSATNTCQACASDSSCSAPTPACQTSGALAGECTQCSTTNVTACPGGSPACDTATGSCLGCTSDSACAGSTPICDPVTAACRACATSADCASFSGTPVCDTAGLRQGQCVACQANADCGGGRPECNMATNTCAGCVTSADCSGGTPVCGNNSGTCMPCSADNQCAALASGGSLPLCQTTGSLAGSCVQCTAQNASQCVAGSATPACQASSGRCGCSKATDCGAGQVCSGGQCLAGGADGGVAEGGSADAGARDAGTSDGGAGDGGARGDGSAADASTFDSGGVGSESFDEGGPSGGDGSLGEDGSALVDAGEDGGSSGVAEQPGDVGGGGGCACSAPGTLAPSGAGGPIGLLLALAALASRRRRS